MSLKREENMIAYGNVREERITRDELNMMGKIKCNCSIKYERGNK